MTLADKQREFTIDRLRKLAHASNWLADLLSGEMTQAQEYNKAYLGFKEGITQKELERLCDTLNSHTRLALAHGMQLTDTMGKIVPVYLTGCRSK